MKKRLWSILWSAAFVCLNFTPVSAEETVWMTDGETENGYCYAEFAANQQGTHQFTLGNNGTFSCEWDGVYNYRAEVGQRFSQFDSFAGVENLAFSYSANINIRGNSYYGVHGSFGSDMPEIFVIEGWGTSRPPGAQNFIGKGFARNKIYDYYEGTCNADPAADNSESVKAIYAVVTTSDIPQMRDYYVNQTTDFTRHIRNLAILDSDYSGLFNELFNAKLEYAALFAEGYGGYSRGSSCKITVDRINIWREPGPGPISSDKWNADRNGVFFLDDYENGIGNACEYGGRGTTTLDITPQYHIDGTHSLAVIERSDDWTWPWPSVAYQLDDYTIMPNTSYSFQMAVMQERCAEATWCLMLMYSDDRGWLEYKELAKVDAKCGEWVILRCSDFQIPSDSSEKNYVSGARLFIDLMDTTEGYYVDNNAYYYVDSTCLSEAGALPEISLADCVPPLPESAQEKPEMVACTGDANCDGVVDVSDAVLVMRYAVADREAVITEQGINNADVDKNGNIDSEDGVNILKYIAKKITLPVTKPETGY
ncbi:MAG: glycoside hydrolase family 11 protein [Oscillospiraceae bacterium]|nr:glycoside hydrolase family 11 protein [Oscillospiraceae bacterium]